MSEGDVRNKQGGTSEIGVPSFVHVAHELKSPLSLIRQLALSLDSSDATPKMIEEAARRIVLTSERALRLTTDLTKMQRLDDSLFVLEPINPMAVCEEVMYEMTPLFREHRKKLATNTRKTPVLAVANYDLLHRVLAHFADNALHYTNKGTDVRFVVSSHQDGRVVRIAVRDYGPGIAKNIWQQLARGDVQPQALSWRPQSSGLGLYLSQRFAGTMNAEIGAIRHKDGTSFYIDLPGSTQMSLL